jgi:hypothetical protein
MNVQSRREFLQTTYTYGYVMNMCCSSAWTRKLHQRKSEQTLILLHVWSHEQFDALIINFIFCNIFLVRLQKLFYECQKKKMLEEWNWSWSWCEKQLMWIPPGLLPRAAAPRIIFVWTHCFDNDHRCEYSLIDIHELTVDYYFSVWWLWI